MLAYGSQDSRLYNVFPGSIHKTILSKKILRPENHTEKMSIVYISKIDLKIECKTFADMSQQCKKIAQNIGTYSVPQCLPGLPPTTIQWVLV